MSVGLITGDAIRTFPLGTSCTVAAIGRFHGAMTRGLTRTEIREFFARLAKAMPEPKTELVYENPYTLLVSVVLSAQATDKSVNKATAELFKLADTPKKMAALGEKRLANY